MSASESKAQSTALWSAQRIVQFVLAGILVVLIVGPLAILVRASFSPPGTLPFGTTAFALQNYWALFTSSGLLPLALNTLEYAAGSVLLAVCLALSIGWLTERTDLPGRTLIRVLMMSWMTVPPLIFAYGWILLTNPSNGSLNNLLVYLFGLDEGPISPYSMTGLIVISGLGLTPTAFVMISGLLRNMDPVLENAGLVLGATRRTVISEITLPLLRPGILSIGMFLIMAMVQSFDFPLIIGLSARIPVLSTRIYTLASPEVGGLPNYGLASAFGIFLLVMAMFLMWGYFRSIRISERFRVVSGKGYRPTRLALGKWRIPAAASIALYLFIMLLPILNLLWASLLPFYRAPSVAALAFVSLVPYRRILADGLVHRAFFNTALLIVLSATIVMTLSFFVSWFAVRTKGAPGKWLDTLTFSPIAMPPIVVAVAVLLLYIRTPLYGTIWILLIGYVTVYIAFGSRTMMSAMLQLHKELEDAAIISGASWVTSLRQIVAPLLLGHIVNGWLWVLAHSARDLTFPLMMLSTSNIVAASAVWTIWDYPDLPGAAALSILMIMGLMAFVIPLQLLAARLEHRGNVIG